MGKRTATAVAEECYQKATNQDKGSLLGYFFKHKYARSTRYKNTDKALHKNQDLIGGTLNVVHHSYR